MSVLHVVFSPVFGVALQGVDELELGYAKLFRNPAALAFSKTNLEVGLELPFPSVLIPPDVPIEGSPPAPLDADLRLLGIAKYLLEIKIETPTNELSDKCIKEELEWAVLPLRILTGFRILTGLSEYCQGGSVYSGLPVGETIERVRREGILASAPMPQGVSVTGTIPREASRKIIKFVSVVNKHRGVLSAQLTVPISTFSNSFYLPSYTDRGINLLIVLEALLSEKQSKRNIKNKVANRAAAWVDGDRAKRKQTHNLISQAFDIRKDVEHASRAKGSETDEYFMSRLEELENVVRHILFEAICRLEQGEELIKVLPGLCKASPLKERGNKAKRGMNLKETQ